MAFTSRLLDPGSSPAAPCAVKVKGGVEFQGVIHVEGDLATDDYDSGLQAMPSADTQLTAARIYVKTIYLFNATDEVQLITIQNAASTQKILDAYPLQPRVPFVQNYAKAADILGLRWHAGGSSSVQGQIVGYQ